MFVHNNIHMRTCTFPDVKTQIGLVLLDTTVHSIVIYLRSFNGTECGNIGHYMVTSDRPRGRRLLAKLVRYSSVADYNPRSFFFI
jgi:hypothetical protein